MKKIFMVGINGSGMSKLAMLMKDFGYAVSGTDVAVNEVSQELINNGIIFYKEQTLPDETFDAVIISSAISNSHPIVVESRNRGIPILRRGEALATIAKNYKSIIVSGTHGKTTTTSMIYHILNKFSMANVYVGGKISLDEHFKKDREFFVIESDESDRSFLYFEPHILLVTNIDRDHLNAYGDSFENLKSAFEELMTKSQLKVVSYDDPNAMEIASKLDRVYFYSTKDPKADIFADQIQYKKDGIQFSLYLKNKYVGIFSLPFMGEKNLLNSLASIMTAKLLGIEIKESLHALCDFTFPMRRLEVKGVINGITLIDDHADHPTEIYATLSAIRNHFRNRRIIAIFEPHRYTRVNTLREEIAFPFKLADVVITKDIYPAFEEPIAGIDGEKVYQWIKATNPGKQIYYASEYNNIVEMLSSVVKKGDIVVLLGPGEIYKVAEPIIKRLRRMQDEKH